MKFLCALGMVTAGLLGLSANADAEPFLTFDWRTNTTAAAADGWAYAPQGLNGCAGAMPEQDRFCNGQHRLFLLYTNYDSDHMGWMRYGVLDIDRSGVRPALKLWATGGRADNPDGSPQDYGSVIKGLKDYTTSKTTLKEAVYADRTLPGMPAIYYKSIATDGPLGIFPQHNRFQMQVWMPPSAVRHARYSRNSLDRKKNPQPNVSWYPFIDTAKGSHYYHLTYNRPYGGWITLSFDAHPSDDNTGVNNETNSFQEGGKHSPGSGTGYFARLAAFAVRFNGLNGSASPTMVLTSPWSRDYVMYENEETINNLAVGYDPEFQAFDVSLEDKYRCAACNARYEVRYSFEPVTNGNFSSATPVLKTENFYIEDDNTKQELVKSNPYGNAVWAKLSINPNDVVRYLNGEALYFAVRDVSIRTVAQDVRDSQMVFTPDGAIEMQRLVKQIKVQYQSPPHTAEIQAPSTIFAQQKQLWLPFYNEGLDPVAGIRPRADYVIRASVLSTTEPVSTLSLKPYQSGEYDMMLYGKSLSGARVQMPVKVKVDAPLCTQTITCSGMPLINTTPSVPSRAYSEWSEWSRVTYPLESGVHAGTYYQIAGKGMYIAGTEMLEIRLKNSGGVSQEIRPRLSARVTVRAGSTVVSPEHEASASWRLLEPKTLLPGEVATWWVPVAEFAQGYLRQLTLHVGHSTQDVQVSSLGVYTEYPLKCSACDALIVDFHAAGAMHHMPQSGWNDVFKGTYTGTVGEGLGIVTGSTAAYNYQGIRGTSELPNRFRKVGVVWRNSGTATYSFSPQYSFTDPDSPSGGDVGTWYKSESLTIAPGGEAVQVFNVPAGTRLINVNVNVNQNKSLWLDKIIGLN